MNEMEKIHARMKWEHIKAEEQRELNSRILLKPLYSLSVDLSQYLIAEGVDSNDDTQN